MRSTRHQPRWVERLPLLGGIILVMGLIALVALVVTMVMVGRHAGQEQGGVIDVVGYLKPHLRTWAGWLVGGLSAFSFGLVLLLAGYAQRRGL
ncbi:MAG: hypothetical protein HYU66_06195 [Armatimonadetes bacterium]|nr:hypothetical protein [Armatimonadota bacterium]